MEKKVMMIRKGTSFMVNAIVKNLEEAGFTVVSVDATLAASATNIRKPTFCCSTSATLWRMFPICSFI